MLLDFFLYGILFPLFVVLVLLLPFQIFKYFQKPKLNKKWFGLFEFLPEATFGSDGQIFIRNIRQASYNPKYEYECKVEWNHKKFNINDISKLWIFINPFGFMQNHIIFSFQFGEDLAAATYLTVSYELRQVDPKGFSIKNLLFKNYEGHFIVAEENDTIYVRTNIRHNYEHTDFYMFPINTNKEDVRKLFTDMMQEINQYSKAAKFYRVFSRNCVTEVFKHLKNNNIVKYNSNFRIASTVKFLYKEGIADIQNSGHKNYKDFKKYFYITDLTSGLENNTKFSYLLRKRFFDSKM